MIGLIGSIASVPQLFFMPDIFYKHYYLMPTLFFIIGLFGGLDLISKLTKRNEPSIIISKSLSSLIAEEVAGRYIKRKWKFIIFLTVVYLTVVGLIYYEYDFRDVSSSTKLSAPGIIQK